MPWELYRYTPPKCCEGCPMFDHPGYGDFGGPMIEPPDCRLGVFLPKRKQTCKRKPKPIIDENGETTGWVGYHKWS